MAKRTPFRLSRRSQRELDGVDAKLQVCVGGAILLTRTDFMVFDGIRTRQEQQDHVKNGTSWTMNSKHLHGQAVDLVPYIHGELTWENYHAFQEIARCMRMVARHHRIDLFWGANKQYGGDWNTRNDMAHFYV